MGCELCKNDNRENNDLRFSREENNPIEVNTKFVDYNLDNETYVSNLEGKLNDKYSIPIKTSEDNIDKKLNNNNTLNTPRDELTNKNKNKNEYIINTLNIYSNNTIQFSSRNKNKMEENKTSENENNNNKVNEEKENIFESTSNIKKEDTKNEEIKKLKKNLRKDSKRDRSSTSKKVVKIKDSNNLTDEENNEKEKKEKKKKDKDKNSNYSRKSSHRSHKKRKKSDNKENKDNNSSDNNSDNNDEDNENNSDEDNNSENSEENNSKRKKSKKSKIKYSYTKQISKNTEKINSLLKDIRHSKIDKILNDCPTRTNTTLEKLIEYFKNNSKKLTLVERAWLVYKWVTENIEYDFEGVNAYSYDTSEEATFTRGKSICSGYAGLYKKICDNLELIVEKIDGFSKVFDFILNENLEDSEKHEWNAVHIEEEWYLIDTTWGSGYSEDGKAFIKKFNPYYFFTPPQEFVRGHLPFISKWQLLPKPKKISQQVFMAFIPLKSNFFTLGFNSIDPDFNINEVKEKGKFTLYFEKNKDIKYDKIKVMAKLYLIENENNNKEIKNSILEIRKEDCYEVNYLISKKGEYKLQIFGSDDNIKEYSELCTLQLISEKDVIKPKTYPTTTEFYYSSDIKIIHPNNGTLKEGTKVTFELKTTTWDKLFLGINTDEGFNYIEMGKDNNNLFKEEDFLIYGKKVAISCKGETENNYNIILEFEVIPITRKKNTITHPQVFAGPKNKLIEPICDKLKRGKKINFSIKSELIEEMAVSDGDNLHKLDKKNGVFTGSVKVSGKEELKIVYKKEDGGYGDLYIYKIF